ncbi:MAG TPA: hypothetical protein VNE62_06520 [Actinomycetota bacterium]|nr:hypothetical protein [Actinomycetota bacterium]
MTDVTRDVKGRIFVDVDWDLELVGDDELTGMSDAVGLAVVKLDGTTVVQIAAGETFVRLHLNDTQWLALAKALLGALGDLKVLLQPSLSG